MENFDDYREAYESFIEKLSQCLENRKKKKEEYFKFIESRKDIINGIKNNISNKELLIEVLERSKTNRKLIVDPSYSHLFDSYDVTFELQAISLLREGNPNFSRAYDLLLSKINIDKLKRHIVNLKKDADTCNNGILSLEGKIKKCDDEVSKINDIISGEVSKDDIKLIDELCKELSIDSVAKRNIIVYLFIINALSHENVIENSNEEVREIVHTPPIINLDQYEEDLSIIEENADTSLESISDEVMVLDDDVETENDRQNLEKYEEFYKKIENIKNKLKSIIEKYNSLLEKYHSILSSLNEKDKTFYKNYDKEFFSGVNSRGETVKNEDLETAKSIAVKLFEDKKAIEEELKEIELSFNLDSLADIEDFLDEFEISCSKLFDVDSRIVEFEDDFSTSENSKTFFMIDDYGNLFISDNVLKTNYFSNFLSTADVSGAEGRNTYKADNIAVYNNGKTRKVSIIYSNSMFIAYIQLSNKDIYILTADFANNNLRLDSFKEALAHFVRINNDRIIEQIARIESQEPSEIELQEKIHLKIKNETTGKIR